MGDLSEIQQYVVWYLTAHRSDSLHRKEILDVGCGDGRLLNMLSESGAEVTGVEISSSGVESTEAKGIRCLQADLSSEIPEDLDTEFDIVVLTEVIEHVFDHVQLLANLNELLGSGGSIILTTPNSIQFQRIFQYLLGRSPTGTQNITHQRFYAEKYLRALLELQGFDVDFANGISSKRTLSRYIPNRYFPHLFISATKVDNPALSSLQSIFESEYTGPEIVYGENSPGRIDE